MAGRLTEERPRSDYNDPARYPCTYCGGTVVMRKGGRWCFDCKIEPEQERPTSEEPK